MLHWKHLLQLTDEQLATHDIAEVNLACATGLPGADQIDQNRCIVRLDHFADAVRHFTAERRESFLADPAAYHHSECVFRVMCLMTLLWHQFGIRYNPAKMDDHVPFDTADTFIHGALVGEGGTCATLPVVYAAVGRRLGCPLKLVACKKHVFVRWDEHGGERFNIEVNETGTSFPPDDYYRQRRYEVTREREKALRFLVSMTPRMELANFLAQRGYLLLDGGRHEEALEAFSWASALDPANEGYRGGVSVVRSRHYAYEGLDSRESHLGGKVAVADLHANRASGPEAHNRGSSISPPPCVGQGGDQQDLELGQYCARRRYYDPTPGRWLNPDPLGFAAGDLNLYRYVQNNPTNAIDPAGTWILAQTAKAAEQLVARFKDWGIEARSYPLITGGRYWVFVPNTSHQRENLAQKHTENPAWDGSIRLAALSGSWNLVAYTSDEDDGVPNISWTKDTVARHPGAQGEAGAVSPEEWGYITYYNRGGQPTTQTESNTQRLTFATLQRVPARLLRTMEFDHLARQVGKYYYVADVAPRGGFVRMLFAKDHDGNYRLVRTKQLELPELVGGLKSLRTAEWAERLVSGYESEKTAERWNTAAAFTTFLYHMVPFGAAWDNAAHGEWGEMGISLVGDAAFFLTGPLASAAKAGRLVKTARALQLVGAGAEVGVGATRATQGIFALRAGDNEGAMGYFGEATLRLLGVSLAAIKALKTARKAKATAAELSQVEKGTGEVARGRKALSNIDSLIERLGDLGGKPVSDAELKSLRNKLWERKVVLDPVGPTDPNAALKLAANERAKFRIRVDKKTGLPQEVATIYFRPGATGYDLQHELFHMAHAKTVGFENYIKLTPKAREQFVFDQMIKPKTWNQLTEQEHQHAVDYLHHVYGGDTRGFAPSPNNPFE